MADVPQPAVLTVERLRKTFPGVTALDGVDLTIEPGEIHALVGQNGSGKSTLIKVLAGVHRPDNGASACVKGEPLALGSSKAAYDLGIRFVHQDLGLVDQLSSVDNLALGFGYATGAARRIRWGAQRARAVAALRNVIDDFPVDRLAVQLSVFQRTALAIARALQDFRDNGSLLVLDEPTATMPRSEVEHLFALLRRIRDRGTPVLLVTHHMEEVFAVADRVTVLRDGRVVTTAKAADLDTGEVVRLMTGGHDQRVDRGTARVGDPVLSVQGLGGTIVRGLDLEVRSGEIVGVAGLGGSGREEICGLIFGSTARAGRVVLDGAELPPARPQESVRRKLGLVPANRHRQGLIMTQSVRQNMTLPTLRTFARGGRIDRKAEIRAVEDAVACFGVKTHSAESGVASLSGGNQQKVVLAKWLGIGPKVLLLDEPTQGVDVAAQADLHQLLIDAAAQGAAIVVCSSDEFELSQLCDRVLVMAAGTVHTELVGGDVTAHQIFRATLGEKSPESASESAVPLLISE